LSDWKSSLDDENSAIVKLGFMKHTFFLFLFILVACGKDSSHKSSGQSKAVNNPTKIVPEKMEPLKKMVLVAPNGDRIATTLAYKAADKKKGLQFVQPEDFSDNQGMLFVYFSNAKRTFWMPNTYFDLDIIYLDAELVIKKIAWDIPSYSGSNPLLIPRAPAYTSRHVLEMKAGSPVSAHLKVGDQLKWNSSLPMEETLQKMKSSL
jgi:uncharacterized membrane protein (UPF0127 family)